jgi:hypothetical protein
MAAHNHGRLTSIASAMLLMATLTACTTLRPVSRPPLPVPANPPVALPAGAIVPMSVTMGLIYAGSQDRDAEGGGLVTVDFGVIPGPVPKLENMSGHASTVAWFSNRGEGGKREARYGWKPRDSAHYELVVLPVANGRTRWVMIEVNRQTGDRARHNAGQLWRCEKYHPSSIRQAGFRDCEKPVTSISAAAESFRPLASGLVVFASVFSPGEENVQSRTAPGWIACDYGCCSLNQQ